MVAASPGMTAEKLLGCEIPGKRVEWVRGQLLVPFKLSTAAKSMNKRARLEIFSIDNLIRAGGPLERDTLQAHSDAKLRYKAT